MSAMGGKLPLGSDWHQGSPMCPDDLDQSDNSDILEISNQKGGNMFRLVALALMAVISGPAGAQAGVPTISIKAVGGWEMICHVSAGGGEKVVILNSSRPSLVEPDLRSASCDTESQARGPVVVTVAGSATVCPFKEASGGNCQRTYKSGANFTVKTKR